MKKTMRGGYVIAAVLLAGLLFELAGGISYGDGGTRGVLHMIDVVMSTIYFLLFLLVPVWLGYKKWTACFVAYGVLFGVVGVMGMLGLSARIIQKRVRYIRARRAATNKEVQA